jgi:hypothetical protein
MDMSVFAQITVVVGALTAAVTFTVSIYRIARRVESAIGVDKRGRTLAERMDRTEHQLWPNGGSSLADKVHKIEESSNNTATEVKFIKDILMTMVEAKVSNSEKSKSF